MKPRRRLKPDTRKDEILRAALIESRRHGYQQITREQVALRAGCAPGLLTHYWGTMLQFRRAVLSAAIAANDLVVVAQGIVARDSKVRRVPPEVQRAALATLMP